MRDIIEFAKYGFTGFLITWTPIFTEKMDNMERFTASIFLGIIAMEVFSHIENRIKK